MPQQRFSFVGIAVGLAVAAATLVTPLGSTAAYADEPTAASVRADLPPGVVKLNDGEDCPPATLCLYRDYGFQGPAYGIGAGYRVDLHDLPMATNNGTAADNVSAWVNNTHSLALLLDTGSGRLRPLFPGQRMQEPPSLNDTVDEVHWG